MYCLSRQSLDLRLYIEGEGPLRALEEELLHLRRP